MAKRTYYESDDHLEDGFEDDLDDEYKPKKRKKRGRTTRKRAKKGSSHLENMPIDMKYEVVAYLDTEDLWNLSITSKALWSALTSKASAFAWDISHKNADLPKCPPDMNQLSYARFIFDNVCENCLRYHAPHILWQARQRFCGTCIKRQSLFVTWEDSSITFPFSTIQVLKENEPNRTYALRVDYNAYHEHLDSLTTKAERTQWEETKFSEQRSLLKLRDEMSRWHIDRERKKRIEAQKEKHRLRQHRFNCVLIKLEEEGWAEEIEKMTPDLKDGLKKVDGVFEARGFGPNSWVTLRDRTIRYMESVQETRLKHEHLRIKRTRVRTLRDVYNTYRRKRPLEIILPSTADLAIMPEFSILIEAPSDRDVAAQDFDQQLEASIEECIKRWRANCDSQLSQMLVSDGMHSGNSLVDRIFFCSRCDCVVYYPQVLVHKCAGWPFSGFAGWLDLKDRDQFSIDVAIIAALGEGPWNQKGVISFSSEKSWHLDGIMRLPNPPVTPEELIQRLMCLFECLSCSSGGNDRVLLVWEDLVRHAEKTYHRRYIRAELLGHEQEICNDILQKRLSTELLGGRLHVHWSTENPFIYVCKWCRLSLTISDVYLASSPHVNHCPQKETPIVECEDFVLHPDAMTLRFSTQSNSDGRIQIPKEPATVKSGAAPC